jgi:hypothetical protein
MVHHAGTQFHSISRVGAGKRKAARTGEYDGFMETPPVHSSGSGAWCKQWGFRWPVKKIVILPTHLHVIMHRCRASSPKPPNLISLRFFKERRGNTQYSFLSQKKLRVDHLFH